MKNKKLVIFDLDDCLTESKQPITGEMAGALADLIVPNNLLYPTAFAELLLEKEEPTDEEVDKALREDAGRHVAIISGASWDQIFNQVLKHEDLHNLDFSKKYQFYILPVSGSQMYYYEGPECGWVQLYNNDLTFMEKIKIYEKWKLALQLSEEWVPAKPWGDIVEDRGSQMTFSHLGQEAPIKEKKFWDPNQKKRKKIADVMRRQLDGFSVKLGGTTSIDVTKEGIDKAYGVQKLLDFHTLNCLKKEDVVFIGDQLQPGGNDRPVLDMCGITCIETSGPRETLKIIKDIINASEGSSQEE